MNLGAVFNASSPSERNAPRPLRRALDLLYMASAILGCLAVCVICGAMLLQVVSRMFGKLAGGTDEITAYACAAAAFLPLAHTLRHGDLVRLTLILSQLGPARRRAVEIFALSVTAAFCLYGTYQFAVLVRDSWRFGDMSQGLLVIPVWIPQLPLVFGFAVLTIAVIDALVTTLLGGKPSYALFDPDHPDPDHLPKE